MTMALPEGHAILHHNIAGSIVTCQVDTFIVGGDVNHPSQPEPAAAVVHLLYKDGQCYVYGVCAPHIAQSIQYQADETRGEGTLEAIFVLFTDGPTT